MLNKFLVKNVNVTIRRVCLFLCDNLDMKKCRQFFYFLCFVGNLFLICVFYIAVDNSFLLVYCFEIDENKTFCI